MDKRSNRVQRVVVREAVWDRRPFLGEVGGEEDKGGKRAGYSPWRRVGIVAFASTVAFARTVALGGFAVLADTETSALADTEASALMGIALVKES